MLMRSSVGSFLQKLNNRVTARKHLSKFTAIGFDAAFQMECMSSEESSDGEEGGGEDSAEEHQGNGLCIRYLAWRSTRLSRLLQITDEEYDKTKLKRGIGKRGRRIGPPKDGNPLPPRGASSWMVSKKWFRKLESRDRNAAERVGIAMQASGAAEYLSPELLNELGPMSEDEEPPPEHRQEVAVQPIEYTHGLIGNAQQQAPAIEQQPEYMYGQDQTFVGAPFPLPYASNPQSVPPQPGMAFNYQPYYVPGQTMDPAFGIPGSVDMSYTSPVYAQHVQQYPYVQQ